MTVVTVRLGESVGEEMDLPTPHLQANELGMSAGCPAASLLD